MSETRSWRLSIAVIFLASARAQTISIDWSDGRPSFDLPHLDDGERMTIKRNSMEEPLSRHDSEQHPEDIYSGSEESDHLETVTVSASGETQSQEALPRGSMRATLKRLAVKLPAEDEDLRSALLAALQKAKMPLLRGLLFERGGKCMGCSERSEFVQAVVASLKSPLVGRHALPLFLYNAPLFPYSQMGLHLYEPRYKLLCRKALKADQLFGFVSAEGGVGTLAKIESWRFSNDDPRDGNCELRVRGLRRFKLGRQWEDKCAGCTSGPLHYADVSYFVDTDGARASAPAGSGGAKQPREEPGRGSPARSQPADAAALVKESLRLYYAVTSRETQRELEGQLGPTPTPKEPTERSQALSMWLAAACVALLDECKAQAGDLLATTSTVERLTRVLKAQRTAAGNQYSRAGSPRRRK